MGKLRFLAWLSIFALLLCGCSKQQGDRYSFEEMTLTLDAAVAEGHFFFAGEILSAGTNETMISYYEMEAEENTFYQVQVTDDFFGCMPEDPITVCIYGTKGNFTNRSNLEKGKEYLFDTTLWVHGEEAVFLLPTFYEGLPERVGESLRYTAAGQTALVDATYEDYKDHLFALAEEKGYGPALVKSNMLFALEQAAARDEGNFSAFERVDAEHLRVTVSTAEKRMEQLKNTAAEWAALEEILK